MPASSTWNIMAAFVVAAAAATTTTGPALAAAAAATPNVVLLMPDDLHFLWDEAPEHPTTRSYKASTYVPNMDSLRSEGVVFEQAMVAGPKCAPARYNLLTSRYCSESVYAGADAKFSATEGDETRVKVQVPSCKLSGSDEQNNLQTTLKNQGYSTIMSGKWHLSTQTWSTAGYEEHVAAVEATGFTDVASVYIENLADGLDFTHNMEWMVDTSLQAVDRSLDEGAPFFLYFAPTAPHSAHSVATAMLEGADTATPNGTLDSSPATTMASRDEMIARVTATGRRDAYLGAVWVDEALGAIMDHLDAKGEKDNTIFIMTMDHGQLAKDTLFEGGLRVALTARYPGSIAAGSRVAQRVTNLDIGPSILAAVGGEHGYSVDGDSWWGLATGATALASDAVADRECVWAEINYDRAVICGSWKYMSQWDTTSTGGYPYSNNAEQLYNLASDPTEQENLAYDSGYASQLAAMKAKLEDRGSAPVAESSTTTTTTPSAGVNHLSLFTAHGSHKIAGQNLALAFTTSEGTAMTASQYVQSYCGDCGEEDFLDSAAKLCSDSDKCLGFTYFSHASDPKVMFKKADDTHLTTAKRATIIHYAKTETLATGTRARRAVGAKESHHGQGSSAHPSGNDATAAASTGAVGRPPTTLHIRGRNVGMTQLQ